MAFLGGLSAFPITPTDQNGHVDGASLRKLLARLARAEVDSVGLLGSTGTYMYLSREERRKAIEVAIDELGSGTPLLVGIGSLRTDEAIRLAQDAKAIGATAGLLSAVSYTPLTEDEVFEHFSAVATESDLPVCIYDNPGTTHFRFTPGLVERLARVPGIVAIKNPAGNRDETEHHLAEQQSIVPDGFSIGYSGDSNSTEAMILGANTWYSVLGGLLPDVCVRIVRAAQNGDRDEARRLDSALSPLWQLFKKYSSLRVIYALVQELDICQAVPPLPILPLAGSAKDEVAETLRRLSVEAVGQTG